MTARALVPMPTLPSPNTTLTLSECYRASTMTQKWKKVKRVYV
uniref:Uncharacterized protein n=1 Tax=Anguilla anguilla TaxID=7936 RepID=A0A0E9U928_ANGAN